MSSIVAATTSPVPPSSGAAAPPPSDVPTIASNFTAFLQLLTTQLQNQNPLDPLDTNQFTQQLVQFAQVEQQLKSNDQLATLVSLQKTAQSTAALNYVGKTVVVDGATAQLTSGRAAWSFSAPRPATATINIKDATGQVAYSTKLTVNPGQQDFIWDGHGTDGTQWPRGSYTMSITAVDANNQPIAISTEIQGMVDSADLSQTPPVLSIGQQTFRLDQIKRVVQGAL
ncbi:MAG TPA: flagellar hook assembly protein FlgD [Xanthobacteraceae bacterium]|nr:flagellar hook assembly protein FlgD [Xanthobacteraceae bacterium]